MQDIRTRSEMTVDKYTTPFRELTLHEIDSLRAKCENIRKLGIVEIGMKMSKALK